MKLDITAVALLTIGPRMCKDKAMQAALRMRQLDRGQKLQLALPREVAKKVGRGTLQDEDLTPKDVLVWIFRNTVESTTAGLPEWASQGSYFCQTKRKPRDSPDRVMREKLTLKDLYEDVKKRHSAQIVIKSIQGLLPANPQGITDQISLQISERAEQF